MAVTGHVRIIERDSGPVFYAALRLEDGSRRQRRLGPAHLTRSRPPKGYLTRPQAEAELAAILAGEHPRISIEPEPEPGERIEAVTFAELAEDWFAYVRDDRKLKGSTVKGYRRELNVNLLPRFGKMPFESIETSHIEEFRKEMVAEGRLAARTINKRLAQLFAIFAYAQDEYDLGVNPVRKAKRQPHRSSGDLTVLDQREIEQLVAHASDPQDACFYRVAATTGMRLGEMRALRWGDINWSRGTVTVRRSYSWGEESTPKSGKVRSIVMPDQAAAALDQLSRRGDFTEPDDLVFISPTGSYIEESALRRRFYTALDDAGLPRIRLHDLRHTFGTLAIQALPPSEVQSIMGHASIQTTDIYIHHTPRVESARKLTAIFKDDDEGESRRTLDAREGSDENSESAEWLDRAENECRGRDSNPRHADYDGEQ